MNCDGELLYRFSGYDLSDYIDENGYWTYGDIILYAQWR